MRSDWLSVSLQAHKGHTGHTRPKRLRAASVSSSALTMLSIFLSCPALPPGVVYSLKDGLIKKLVGPISRNGEPWEAAVCGWEAGARS